MYKILFIILFLFITFPAIGAEKGRIEYTPRIDYSLINTKEFEDKAFQYYTIAIQSTIKEEQIKNAETPIMDGIISNIVSFITAPEKNCYDNDDVSQMSDSQ